MVPKEPLKVEKANKLTGYNHCITGPWKICAQMKLCKGRLGWRYETGLLWRKEDVRLPNNRCEAERRRCGLKRKFSRDPDLEQRYRAVMNEYIGKGYARKLLLEEADHLSATTWYLTFLS